MKDWPREGAAAREPPPVIVKIETGNAGGQEFSFRRTFRVGRADDCDIRLSGDYVSRSHLQVSFTENRWWILDLGTTNRTLMDGQRIHRVPVTGLVRLKLGGGAPVLLLTV